MTVINACCCWFSLRTGSKATAVFTLLTAIANIIIDIWGIVELHWMHSVSEPNELFLWWPPGTLPLMYIELVMNLVLIAFSIILYLGTNKGYSGKRFVYTWIIGVCIFRGYEIFLGIYAMGWIGAHRYHDMIFVIPEALFIVVYWLINTILLVTGLLCVISYWQSVVDQMEGKVKRVRYLAMLENIQRAAAQGAGGRSFYTTMYNSQGSLANITSKGSTR